MAEIKNVFFDYHGVLDKRSYSGMLKKSVPENLYQEFIDLGKRYAAALIDPLDFWGTMKNKIGEGKTNEAKAYLLKIELNRDLWSRLPKLKKKYSLGILSNCSIDKSRLIKSNIDLHDNFSKWYFSSDYHMTKDNEYFLNLMLNGSRNPEEVLFVDNSKSNIDKAESMGFRTHLYDGSNSFIDRLL